VDYSMIAAAWITMSLFSLGIALLVAALTEYDEVWEKLVGPFQYLILPLSGCFFMVDWLPTFAQDLIWFNPMTHCFEAFRAGLMGDQTVTHYDLWYPLFWALVFIALGLRMLETARDRMHFG
jgi:capsular polysaccharide transport system permease protein